MAENNQKTGKRARGKGRPFAKGISGNPGGRKSEADLRDVREKARQYTAEALQCLASIMRSKKASAGAKAVAAQALLDRGHGRPTQHVEANVNLLDGLSYDDRRSLETALATLAAGADAPAGGTSGTTH